MPHEEGAEELGLGGLLRRGIESENLVTLENTLIQLVPGTQNVGVRRIPCVLMKLTPHTIVSPVSSASGRNHLIGGVCKQGVNIGLVCKGTHVRIVQGGQEFFRISHWDAVTGLDDDGIDF